MTQDSFNKTIDKIQAGLMWFVVSIITVCIAVLFLFDVLAGTGTMLYLTNQKEWQSVIISVATTGLLFALMFIGYMLFESKNRLAHQLGWVVGSIAACVYIMDVIFDSLLADILRYGVIDLTVQADPLQWMFRGLMGGISTIGDALAVAMILGMPVLKNIVKNTFNSQSSPSPVQMRSVQSRPQPQKQQSALDRIRDTQKRVEDDEDDLPEFIRKAI